MVNPHSGIVWCDGTVDLTKDSIAMQRLKELAEQAKKEPFSLMSIPINIQYLAMISDGPSVHLDKTLARASVR